MKYTAGKFNQLVYNYPIRIPERFSLVIRSLLTQEGICFTLKPDFKFLEVKTPFLWLVHILSSFDNCMLLIFRRQLFLSCIRRKEAVLYGIKNNKVLNTFVIHYCKRTSLRNCQNCCPLWYLIFQCNMNTSILNRLPTLMWLSDYWLTQIQLYVNASYRLVIMFKMHKLLYAHEFYSE